MKRFSALLLSICMAATLAVPVSAEPVSENTETQIAADVQADEKTETDQTVSEDTMQMETVDSDISESKVQTVEDSVSETIGGTDSTDTSASGQASLAAAVALEDITYTLNEAGNGGKITAKSISVEGGYTNVAFHIWSDEGGEDDGKWIDAVKDGSDASADILLKDYKHFGNFHVEVYVGLPSGGAALVGSKSDLEIKDTYLAEEIDTDYDETTGDFSLTVEKIENTGYASAIAFCVTSPKGAHWYDVEKQEDGTYLTKGNAGDLGNAAGTYTAELYVKDVQNRLFVIGSVPFTFEAQKPEVTAEPVTGGYTATTTGLLLTSGIRNVAIQTYSVTGGKDDETWLDAKLNGTEAVCSIDASIYKHYGEIQINVYVADPSGKASLVCNTKTTLVAPELQGDITASADDSLGTFNVTAPGFTSEEMVNNVAAQIVNPKGGENWFDMERQEDGSYVLDGSLSKCGGYTGTYTANVYLKDKKGDVSKVGDVTFTIQAVEAKVTAEESDAAYLVKAVPLQSASGIKNVAIRTYSSTGGTDDERWLDASLDGTAASCTVPMVGYKHYGEVVFEVYVADLNGKVTKAGSTTADMKAPEINGKTTVEKDDIAGKFTITIPGFINGNTLTSVAAQVVNPAGNETWLAFEKQVDGSYILNSDIAKCGSYVGAYTANIYVKDVLGIVSKVDTVDFSFNAGEVTVTASANENGFEVIAKGILLPGGVRNVALETWSDEGGQDDVKWVDMLLSGTTADTQVYMAGFKHYGLFHVRVYAATNSGQVIQVGNEATVEVAGPKGIDLVPEKDNAAGTYKLTATFENAGSINNVAVAVTSPSGSNQWYDMERQADGSYLYNGSISAFDYAIGTYSAHVYVKDILGDVKDMLSTEVEFGVDPDPLKSTVSEITKNIEYKVTVEPFTYPGGFVNLAMKVSNDEGTKVTKWYDVVQDETGNYVGSFPISKFGAEGTYTIEFYVKNNAGKAVLIGTNNELDVECNATANVEAAVNTTETGINVKVTVQETDTPISGVKVAAWTKEDKSDLYTYDATLNEDDTYDAAIDPTNHKGDIGTYNIEAQAVFANNVVDAMGNVTCEFNPQNYVVVYSEGVIRQRTMKAWNLGETVYNAAFYVYNEADGQGTGDHWYAATKQEDGSWIGTFQTSNHLHAGTYRCVVYVNRTGEEGAFEVCSTEFTISQDEFAKNGWFYENGYKLYYMNDVLQTDVSSLVTGPYYIRVNRTTCTVTVYAKDNDTGKYIVPVCRFACSVGLPGTETPTGTYKTLNKMRWVPLMGPSWGQYGTQVIAASGIWFHSVAGTTQSIYNVTAAEYNRLGSPASHGCIRLNVKNAKWIYDNCSIGTTVNIYDSSDPGPFGQGEIIRIPEGQTWDPTDPAITG